MSKRFIDDKIWSDPWFQDLDPILKLFWIYLFSICDIVGIWEYNKKRAEFDLCKKLPWDEIKKKLEEKVLFTERFWIIKTFIKQQYPKLSDCPNAPLHISVMKQINKMCLNFDLNSLSIDYSNPIDRVQVKVIVKEEVKEEVFINKQTSINTSASGGADLFNEFWNAYPKKQGKGSAIKAWKKIKHPVETLEKIITALSWQKKSPDWRKEKGQYIPMPATYLNGVRWEDEPTKNNDDEKSGEDRRRVFLV